MSFYWKHNMVTLTQSGVQSQDDLLILNNEHIANTDQNLMKAMKNKKQKTEAEKMKKELKTKEGKNSDIKYPWYIKKILPS